MSSLVQGQGPLQIEYGQVLPVTGVARTKKRLLAVMDMWNVLAGSTRKLKHAPQAAIVFDEF
ncbi:MAG: hypothetical protein P0120_09055 [Nitrospira sp.]|nr:hypothetical protein [Nitrospira sp.]